MRLWTVILSPSYFQPCHSVSSLLSFSQLISALHRQHTTLFAVMVNCTWWNHEAEPVSLRCCRAVLSATWHKVNSEKKKAEWPVMQAASQSVWLTGSAWLSLTVLSCLQAAWCMKEKRKLLSGSSWGLRETQLSLIRSWKGVCFDFNLCVASAFCGLLNAVA